MKRVGFYYDDIFLKHHTPLWHPETPSRLINLITSLKASGVWNDVLHLKPKRADFEDLALVHTEYYLERIKNARVGHLDADTYFSEGSLESSLYAVGSVISAIDEIKDGHIDRAFCAVRPPGHHAESYKAMGFCIFNNIAVAARYAQKTGYKRVFIIDFDVHHGNGTQNIFYKDNTVFYFSTHQYPHYPGTGSEDDIGIEGGEGFTYNIPIDAGAGDVTYGRIYNDILPPIIEDFAPNIILVSAGYDIHKHDPLSTIRVTNDGVRSIVRGILRSANVPFVFALEGGYNIPALEDSIKITIEELLYS